jgi:WD40 repeat protein
LANRYSAENADYTWAQYVLYGDPRTGLFGRTRIEPKLLTLAYLQIGTRDSKSGFDLGKLRRLVDLCVARLPGAEVLELNENSAILLFPRHTDAARFVFLAASELESKSVLDLPYRMGIATGELLIERGEDGTPLGVTGFARDLAEKLAELAGPCQTLLTRDVFDNARSLFQGTDYASGREMVWRDHGYFRFEDADEIVGVCEAGISGISLLQVPDGNQSLHRLILPEWEPILGWRPAPGQVIPSAPEWAVVEKLGEGGFGEVWRTRHRTSGNSKIFKFCFHPDRLRSLKREVALLKIIKNRLGERPDIVRIEQINLETPPYFLVMDDTGYRDLVTWRSNLDEKSVPTLDYRIEIVAKIGDALQAAHDAGVIHRDIKPSNVLVSGRPEDLGHLQIKLTDFGIGQVHTSGAPLTGTMTGFTGTLSQPEKAGQGTLMYLAPEALLGVFGSARSDIYSLGVILYQILVDDFSRPIAVGWERDLDDPDLMTDLEKCLSRNPEERFRSPGELAENLRSLEARRQKRRDLERQERRERRRKRIAVGLGIFSLVGFLVAASLGLGLRRAREAEFRERVARLEAERGLYHSHIHEAHRAVQDRDLLRAQEILYDCPDYLRGWEWGRLVYLCNLDQRIFSGHENPIHSMALSADGKILATGDEEGTLIAWDFESAQVLWRAKNRGGGITDLAINSDGDKVAETDGNGIRVRDLASGHPIRRFQCLEPTGVKLRFAPDRDLLAASNGQGMLVLFDLTENATSAIAVGNGNVIADLAFTPDGTSIITVGYDANLRIFDVETLQQMDSIDGEGVAVNAVAVDKDGGEFAIAFGDRIRRGRLPGFELLPLEKEVPGSVHCLSISPGNKFIAYKTNQGVYGILDLQTFEDLFVGSGAGPARSVLFTPTGDSFLVAGRDHRVRQYRCSRRLAEIKLSGHTGFVPRLCFSGDGRRLATGSDDRTVRLWDTRTGEATAILEVSDGVASLAFSPEDDCLAAGTRSGRVVIWSTSGTSELADFQAHTGVATSIAFHPNGSSFATGGFDGRIRVWDRSDFTLQLTIEADRIGVFTVVYTPDGERLVSGGGDPTLKEWDTKSGSLVRTYSGHASQVFGMLLFSEGKRMISGSSDRRAILWDRQTGESIGSIHEKESALFGLRVTPDMNRLFTNGRLWDLENFRPIMELPNRDRTLSPDGLLMAEGGEPNHLSILPAFPWRDTDLSEKPGPSVRERVEAYKQRYWSKRQDLAGSRN